MGHGCALLAFSYLHPPQRTSEARVFFDELDLLTIQSLGNVVTLGWVGSTEGITKLIYNYSQ